MHSFDQNTTISDSHQDELLDDLEVRCQTNVAAVREVTSHRLQMRVNVRSGNACDRQQVLTTLQTSELSTETTTGIANMPVMVGSVFRLECDRSALDIPTILAICERCSMLGDTSFELRFRFAQPIELNR